MKKLLFFSLFIPSLLLGKMNGNFHSNFLFEENVGQVILKSELFPEPEQNTSENPEIKFVLQGGALTYYFSDRGYSVVQKNENGNLNRTDFFFQNQEKFIPVGENEIESGKTYYLAKGKLITKQFAEISYGNLNGSCSLKFSIDGNTLVRKLFIPNGNYSSFSFDVSGSEVEPILAEGITGYNFNSSSGNFSETVVQDEINFHVGNVLDNLEWSLDEIKPEYTFSARQINPDNSASSSIVWLTYLGGTNAEDLFSIALTPDSGCIVTGRTGSIDFPTTPGAMQDTLTLSYDVIITRFDSDGNCLWSTYYGGTNFEGAYQVVVFDSTIVITGMTNSTDLPMTNPTQPTNAGSYDAFLLVLDSAGQMIRSTYYGGTGADQGLCMAKGNAGEIVIGGSVTSNDLPFASSGFQGANGGVVDAFLAVFDDSLNVQWSSYYGGNGVEDIHAIIVTLQNEIVFVGGTRSFNFPVTPNAWQSGLLNQPDNYLVKFGMDGLRHYATFFGGTNNEDANGVESDEAGNLYMTGFTYSADFPTMGTIFQPTLLGQQDVFVSKFDSTGQLVWSTFVGGGGQDVAWGMTRLGKYIFIGGQTESPTFPVSANAIQSSYALNGDGFVIKMDTTGQMISGTFMGGNGLDAILAITVDADTNVFATGDTYSTDLSVTPGAFQMSNATNGDGFIVKFGMSEEMVGTTVIPSDPGSAVSVFPNPSNEIITIKCLSGEIRKVEISDQLGRLVKSEIGNAESVSVDVSSLSKGIYLLRIVDENSDMHVLRLVRN